MIQTNDLMFNEITQIAQEVAYGGDGIANASNSLAQSCTNQVHSIADFKVAVVEQFVLGGDAFRPYFHGNLCELVIYNEVKDDVFVKEQYEAYVNREDFLR